MARLSTPSRELGAGRTATLGSQASSAGCTPAGRGVVATLRLAGGRAESHGAVATVEAKPSPVTESVGLDGWIRGLRECLGASISLHSTDLLSDFQECGSDAQRGQGNLFGFTLKDRLANSESFQGEQIARGRVAQADRLEGVAMVGDFARQDSADVQQDRPYRLSDFQPPRSLTA